MVGFSFLIFRTIEEFYFWVVENWVVAIANCVGVRRCGNQSGGRGTLGTGIGWSLKFFEMAMGIGNRQSHGKVNLGDDFLAPWYKLVPWRNLAPLSL